MTTVSRGWVTELLHCVRGHDLERLVDCFAHDYLNETPAHPARGFTGRDQVRANWRRMFAAVPDLHAEVLDVVADGSTVWTEWEMSGTRVDGAAHLVRGVIVFEVADGRATRARFYLEPVDHGPETVDGAVVRLLGEEA